MRVLKTIQWELTLPNHNFLPEDPLLLIMNSAYDLDDLETFCELEEYYGVKYRDEDYERMKDEQWTLGRFVADVLARANESRD